MASPVNPRLLQFAPPVRSFILRTGLAQGLSTVLLVFRGILIGLIAASVIEVGFGSPETNYTLWFVLLGVVIAAHGGMAWVSTSLSHRAVGDTIEVLRARGLDALRRRDPREVEEDSATWRHVFTRGLEDFRPYVNDFLPSLVSLIVSTPIVLVVVFAFDWVSGLFALFTLPLIPIFMVLIGKLTAAHTKRRLEVTSGLGDQVADLLAGSRTLKALHATERPSQQIRETGTKHEKATMSVLRLAFLSSFALEFVATLSVALVAVSIGLRLVYGEIDLLPGLVVLIIIPEVYNPIRTVGTNYHAAVDGMEAADTLFDLIESPAASTGSYVTHQSHGVHVSGLSVTGRDGIKPHDLSLSVTPGKIVTLTGPNGSGKSTALLAILGVLPDEAVSGAITVSDSLAFLPARPAAMAGSVKDNIELMGAISSVVIKDAVGLELADERSVGVAGTEVSAGQMQRIGLARVLAKHAELYLLDEPTAHLSPEYVEQLCTTVQDLAAQGHGFLIATHDERVLDIADEVISL